VTAKHTCLRCGSDQIIPNVPLSDKQGEWGSAPLEVQVHGNPDAWVFKDTEAGQLVAFICGACGHTELKTQGFVKLYRKYQDSLRRWGEEAQEGHEQAERQESETGEPLKCLLCGRSIPADSSRCQSCGWTWEEPYDGQGEERGERGRAEQL
jgi:hypothetical protein